MMVSGDGICSIFGTPQLDEIQPQNVTSNDEFSDSNDVDDMDYTQLSRSSASASYEDYLNARASDNDEATAHGIRRTSIHQISINSAAHQVSSAVTASSTPDSQQSTRCTVTAVGRNRHIKNKTYRFFRRTANPRPRSVRSMQWVEGF